LPKLRLAQNLKATTSYDEAFDECGLYVWAIPVQFTRERLKNCGSFFPENSIIINLSKGFESGTCYRPSQIIAQECRGAAHVGTLGGPNLASEISAGMPAAATLAIDNHWEHLGLESVFSADHFTVDISPHLIALEVAGALKNIIAIASGVCDGLNLGWNVKASLIAKGFDEMQKVGCELGASRESFANVFALGDLIATCGSNASRNWILGNQIGMGYSLEDAKKTLGGRVAEGAATVLACRQFAEQVGIILPLMFEVYEILLNGLDRDRFVAAALSST